MNLLYPRLRKGSFSGLLKTAVIGALVAGGYGIVHDQITYTISPEYFTCFKFRQFGYADPGLGDRAFVIVIGILATWWVGFFSGWFLWRLGVGKDGEPPRPMAICRRFVIIFTSGIAGGIVGFFYGRHKVAAGGLDHWLPYTESIGVGDPAAFVTVGQIHNFGYLGAAVGLVAAGIAVRRDRGEGARR